MKKAFNVLFEIETSVDTLKSINKGVEKVDGTPNWFESLEDFNKQICQGFVEITEKGFNIMVDDD